jgi:hypothetical protein
MRLLPRPLVMSNTHRPGPEAGEEVERVVSAGAHVDTRTCTMTTPNSGGASLAVTRAFGSVPFRSVMA